MNEISITKEFSWDMAHMLAGHDGLCKNLHGHTYKMQVEVCKNIGTVITDDSDASHGMIIDFKDLKNIINAKVIEPLDHAFIYRKDSSDPLEKELAEILKKYDRKILGVNYRTTVEELTLNIFNELDTYLDAMDIQLKSIKIWETPESFAEVKRGDNI